jgi:hypothetical protein
MKKKLAWIALFSPLWILVGVWTWMLGWKFLLVFLTALLVAIACTWGIKVIEEDEGVN